MSDLPPKMTLSGLQNSFRQRKILVIGDVMLDQFIWGQVRRISPEAPVPVVEVSRETWYPGGAANVARNLAPFTSGASLIGRIGQDRDGESLTRILTEEGISTKYLLCHEELPTISKVRIIARQQQVVRVDREKRAPVSSSELDLIHRSLEAMLPKTDAIILEDYGKGLITQDLVQKTIALARSYQVPVLVDPSPHNPLDWSGVDLVKPNRVEAFACAELYDRSLPVSPLENPDILQVGRILLEKWDVQAILMTLGEQGMMLFIRDREPHHIPTRAREVYDVSGAGDTVIALLSLGIASGLDLIKAAEIANHASGIVVGKLGTASVDPEELFEACRAAGVLQDGS